MKRDRLTETLEMLSMRNPAVRRQSMPRVSSTDAPRLTKARGCGAKVFFENLERCFNDAGIKEDEDKKEYLTDYLPRT
jgi:hypothetical protein